MSDSLAKLVVPERPVLADSIMTLMKGASIETSAKNVAEIDTYASILPAGTDVFVAWIPGMAYHHVVSIARRLRETGLNPVPHIAARQVASAAAMQDFLGRLRDEAQVTRALVIAGDSDVPLGPYGSSLALLQTGLLEAHGIRSVGIAGYPEGHAKIGDGEIASALDGKIECASNHGLDLFIVTQFCFDGQVILDWLQRLRTRGITLPVRVGVAGPASLRTLFNYALRCGVGNSIRALGTKPISLPRLLAQQGPEKVVQRLAQGKEGVSLSGLHFFAFGNPAATFRWIDNVSSGRFQLDEADGSMSVPA